jgi:ATP-dependent Clp protease ATP-binding subunit ClpA
MAKLETYRDRFAESGWEIFERALQEARWREQNYVSVAHTLYALAEEKAELFTGLLQSLADNERAFAMLEELILKRIEAGPKHEGEGVRLGSETIDLFKRTLKRVRANGRQRIEATDLFITLVMDEQSLLRELLRRLLADPEVGPRGVRDLVAVVESALVASRPLMKQKYRFLAGEMVRIKSGPFANFTGTVEEINEDNSTLRIAVFILGREQPVELRFLDVEKLKSE